MNLPRLSPNYMIKFVMNFIPIIILFLLATYTPEFAKFSHTILGKAIAVMIILFYVKMDITTGLLVCALVIFYYQTDYVESFNNMLKGNQIETFVDKEEEIETMKNEEKEEEEEVEAEDKTKESFETLENAYKDVYNPEVISLDASNFRKLHCEKGHLIDKGQVVNPEMAEHIYPEVKQKENRKCNICDPACDFDVVENRILIETDLKAPKSSNDMFTQVWENLKNTVK